MIIAKVIGTVVTTISNPHFKNRRLLVVQPLVMPGEKADEDFVAIDNTHAGIGDTVLINREGGGARQVLNNPDAPIISVIVGILDSVTIEA
jgi:microcompartment protein CcmK/EutM